MSFSLLTLDVEDCGMSVEDMLFLADSKHCSTLNSISIGDVGLGNKFEGISVLLQSVQRVSERYLLLMLWE